jgi:hypothetical protein
VTSAAFVVAFSALTVFIVLYAAIAPFYRNPAGRALMVMSAGFWLVTLAQVLRHPFGLSTADSTWFTWFQVTAVTVAIAGIGWITAVLVRAQWRGRRHGRRYFEDAPGNDSLRPGSARRGTPRRPRPHDPGNRVFPRVARHCLPGLLRPGRLLAEQVQHVLDGHHALPALLVDAEHGRGALEAGVGLPPPLQLVHAHLDRDPAGTSQGSHSARPFGIGAEGLTVPANTPLT